MPSERPETWSDWAHVERLAGAPMPAIRFQVAPPFARHAPNRSLLPCATRTRNIFESTREYSLDRQRSSSEGGLALAASVGLLVTRGGRWGGWKWQWKFWRIRIRGTRQSREV